MRPVPLFEEESAEDLCELIKALHTEMVEMRAEMQRGFDVLLAVKGDDTEALRKMIVSAPPAVVPFEDEAAPVVEPLPVLACCPMCTKKAIMEVQIEFLFGYRTMADGKTIVQSWCRECRALEGKTNPRKKQRLPDDVRALGQKARDLNRQADKVAASRAAALEASKGRETRESVVQLTIEQDLRLKAVELLSEYDKARGIIRKNNKSK